MTNTWPPINPAETEARLKADFENWFVRLQALSKEPLNGDDWTERWFDGFTPEEALEAGPEED